MTELSTRVRARIVVPHCVLRVMDGEDREKQQTFQQRRIRIGRDADNDFVLNDPSISSHHLTLLYDPQELGYQLLDESSTNGVWINNVKIIHAYVSNKATLQLGDTTLELSPQAQDVTSIVAMPGEANGKTAGLRFSSKQMLDIFGKVSCLAQVHVPVVFLGETGTGKGTLATQLHRISKRSEKPFVHVNCAAIPSDLFEAQLFGYKKGAFTGATRDHQGFLEQAHLGTLFLDEIAELSLEHQSKLLLALDKGEFYPIGTSQPIRVDLRLLTATNRDLMQEVEEGRFREDLYYRIAVYELPIPPLRERPEDTEALLEVYLEQFLQENPSQRPLVFSKSARERLLRSPWPGNIRQLHNIVFAAATHATLQSTPPPRQISEGDLPAQLHATPPKNAYSSQPTRQSDPLETPSLAFGDPFPLYEVEKKKILSDFQRGYIQAALARAEHNITRVSEISGLNRAHIYTLKKELKL